MIFLHLKFLRWVELCFKLCEISASVCAKVDPNRFDYWAFSYVYALNPGDTGKAYITFLAVGLTHSQQGQNSQPGSKLNEICAFDYPILVIPRWGRQTIYYIILLTGIGAKMSHVACHTIRAHFSHSYAKESKFKKILFLIGDKILRFSKNYERTRFSLREL